MTDQKNSGADKLKVRSVLRVLEILECFTPTRPKMTLSELSEAADLPLSTARRLISTLFEAGYLRKTEDSKFACGPRLLSVALASLQGLSVYDVSKPHLKALRDATGETANLAVPGADGQFVYVMQSESKQAIRHRVWLGKSVPLEGTAMGDAMLGKLNDDDCAIREVTLEPDVSAIASPLRDNTGQIVGGFSVTMPTYRSSAEILKQYSLLVKVHAWAASRELGWFGQGPDFESNILTSEKFSAI